MWQNPNDPDDENEYFKQLHIAIEKNIKVSVIIAVIIEYA